MSEEVADLKIRIQSVEAEQAKRRLDELTVSGKRTENMVSTMGTSMATSMLRFTAGAAIVGALTSTVSAATREWLQYDVAMKEVGSITNQSQESLSAMRKDVLDLSVAMGVDATVAAKGLYQALSAGISKEDSISFLGVAAQTAVAGVTDVATSVDVLTNVLNAYKIPAAEAESVTDKLLATVINGKTTIAELSANMSKGTVSAASLGVSLEELLASVAAITLQGTPTAEAFTQINATITALLDPSDQMKEALKEIGFESGRAAIEAIGYGETLNRLRGVLGDNDAAFVKAFRSIEAFKGVLSQTGPQMDTFNKGLDGITKSLGTSDKAFKTNAETLANAQTALKNSFTSLVENFEAKWHVFQTLGRYLKEAAAGIQHLQNVEMSGGNAVALSAGTMPGVGQIAPLTEELNRLHEAQKRLRESESLVEDPSSMAGAFATLDAQIRGVSDALGKYTYDQLVLADAIQKVADAEKSGDAQAIASSNEKMNALMENQERLNEAKQLSADMESYVAEQEKAINAERAVAGELAIEAEKERAKQNVEAIKLAERLNATEESKLQTQIESLEKMRESNPEQAASAEAAIAKLEEELRLLQEKNALQYAEGVLLPPKDWRNDPFDDSLRAKLVDEEQLISDSYGRRKSKVLEATSSTETERNAIMAKGSARALQTIEQETLRQHQMTLSGFSDFFGNLAELGKVGNEKAFKIAQAASIAQATVKMYESAVAAYAQGAAISPYLGPVFAAAALAAGAANVASIKSQTFRAYASGGLIPSGEVGIVGEAGPEFVRGPAVVTSANASRGLLDRPGSERKPVQIVINNLPGQSVDQEASPDGDMVLLTVRKTIDALTDEANNGGGKFVPALQRKYGLTRKT